MYAENSEALSGNAQYEGYSVDLIQYISEILGESKFVVKYGRAPFVRARSKICQATQLTT